MKPAGATTCAAVSESVDCETVGWVNTGATARYFFVGLSVFNQINDGAGVLADPVRCCQRQSMSAMH
jgi:hypothetical protein